MRYLFKENFYSLNSENIEEILNSDKIIVVEKGKIIKQQELNSNSRYVEAY